MGRYQLLDGPEAAVAQRFDDGVVLGELLGVRVGELDGAAPAEEVLGRSDGGTELTMATVSRSGWPAYGKSGFAVLSLANAAASSAGAGLTVVSTGAGTKGDTLTIEPRREGIFECDCE